jgi:hypothetical protein
VRPPRPGRGECCSRDDVPVPDPRLLAEYIRGQISEEKCMDLVCVGECVCGGGGGRVVDGVYGVSVCVVGGGAGLLMVCMV